MATSLSKRNKTYIQCERGAFFLCGNTTIVKYQFLFEDAHVLVVSKPADMATHPNEPGQTGTCMNHVMAYVKKQGGVYAEHVHRLDQGTKGLVLIAQTSTY